MKPTSEHQFQVLNCVHCQIVRYLHSETQKGFLCNSVGNVSRETVLKQSYFSLKDFILNVAAYGEGHGGANHRKVFN